MDEASIDAVLDRLDEVMVRLDEMEKAQKRSNSRLLRPALIASLSSQLLAYMALVTATSWTAAAAVVALIIFQAWAIWKVVPALGKKEWPQDELDAYRPYEWS